MTDADLVKKRLATIETCLSELTRLARPEAIDSDVRERRFVEAVVHDVLERHLGDLTAFVETIRRRLGSS